MVIRQSGGTPGLRDLNGLESALAQPLMTFGGEDLYPSLVEKAAALGFSLVMNHPFVDGILCAESLLRSPRSLADLLEAVGQVALERTRTILDARVS